MTSSSGNVRFEHAHDDHDDGNFPGPVPCERAPVANPSHQKPKPDGKRGRFGISIEPRVRRPQANGTDNVMLEISDHRALGLQLDLFHLQEEAPGMVFWHPRGLAMYRALENAVRSWTLAAGFEEVKTPELIRSAIWEQSGHW